jgi:15-cis-phytoene synthase
MVTVTSLDPETELAISYAPRACRPAVHALFALDAALGHVLRSTTEPLLGQMRLTWWWEALGRLDREAAPPEPVLRAIAASVLPLGITGARLGAMVDGWEALLEDPLDEAAILRYGDMRGAGLFAIAGDVLDCGHDPIAEAGRGWALADLALHVRDDTVAAIARAAGAPALREANRTRWSRQGRMLGALARLGAIDLARPAGVPGRIGGPRRVARMGWHRLTGR